MPTPSSPPFPGGCLCGAVRYQLLVAPDHLCDCHCVDCRRASGAAYVTWGSVPRDALVVLSGEVRTVSHAGRIRSFAGCCGTPLFFNEGIEGRPIGVTIATLDDPAPYPPEISIWTEDRLPWIVLSSTDPACPQEDPSYLLP